MRNDLFNMSRAWGKEKSESPTGFEPMTLKFTIFLYDTHDDCDIADPRSIQVYFIESSLLSQSLYLLSSSVSFDKIEFLALQLI